MARTKVQIDKTKLSNAISEVEKKTTFTSRTELFKAVAETTFAKGHTPPLTSSVIALRFAEYNLTCTTPKGTRGRPKGSKNKAVLVSESRMPVPDVETVSDEAGIEE